MRVLIYAQELKEAEPLARVFRQSGLHSDVCNDVERMYYLSMTERYVAVVVKGNFSAQFLTSTYRDWKATGCTSLFVVISAVDSTLQRAKMLELGMDRYYIEPCSYTLLVSDILKHEYEHAITENHIHATEYFELDLLRRTAKAMGIAVRLTKTEFDLLALLVRRKGIVLSRVQIWEEVWGYDEYPLANTVDVHMNRLRKKLPPAVKSMLTTVYGIGYRLQADA